MTRNTVALYDMVVSVSPTSAAWLLLVAGQSWPMTADSAFGLGALPNRAMQVMPPRCLYPGAPPSGRATRPHAPGCCSGSGAQTDGWDCRDPQCRMRVTVVSRADYCAGPYRYGCSAPRARPSRRHCHRQIRSLTPRQRNVPNEHVASRQVPSTRRDSRSAICRSRSLAACW